MRYVGSNKWLLLRDPEDPIAHVHSCTECYDDFPCEEECTLEPDLELDDGTPRGAFSKCDRCEPREPEPTPVWVNPDQLWLF